MAWGKVLGSLAYDAMWECQQLIIMLTVKVHNAMCRFCFKAISCANISTHITRCLSPVSLCGAQCHAHNAARSQLPTPLLCLCLCPRGAE